MNRQLGRSQPEINSSPILRRFWRSGS